MLSEDGIKEPQVWLAKRKDLGSNLLRVDQRGAAEPNALWRELASGT